MRWQASRSGLPVSIWESTTARSASRATELARRSRAPDAARLLAAQVLDDALFGAAVLAHGLPAQTDQTQTSHPLRDLV
jgi:hypothetical protein